MSEERVPAKLPNYLDENGVPTCPKCGCQDTRVTHSLGWGEKGYRRRRVCNNDQCGWVFPLSFETFCEPE